jgi:hypothetical protein
VTHGRWFGRPAGEGIVLRKAPRLASWDKSTDLDQARLRKYLEDTAELVAEAAPSEPRALLLEVGLPPGRDLIDMADLDNYAFPLATHLHNEHLVSVWCTKRRAETPTILIAPARQVAAPATTYRARTTASSQTRLTRSRCAQPLRTLPRFPRAAVQLQISFVVGPHRNWINLWKPTMDALDPLLGRTRADRDWHPQDGRITSLGLHRDVDPSLGHDVLVTIAAEPPVTGRG